jgi:hypothetical protein
MRGGESSLTQPLNDKTEETPMCDYSLHLVASRPAKVGDKLVTTEFATTVTRGFAAIGEPDVAVCLLPGTELAFDDDVRYDRTFDFFKKARAGHKVARFRQVDIDQPHAHHDALEFPGGRIVLVTRLVVGQTATVLQLPASVRDHGAVQISAQAAAAPVIRWSTRREGAHLLARE